MMEVYKTPSKDVQEIVLANVTYEAVIDGLNGYFASEPRNDYITVKMESDKQNFALYEAEAWADILIEWLRTEHGIFYYPGMEAKHAKIERIPPLTERLMDEGALNSLKALHKRVIGQEAGTNSHTLIADDIKYFVNAKESEIKKLKDRIAELESNFKAVCDEDDIFRTRALKAEEEVRNLNAELATKWTKTSLINWLQQRARHKGVELDDAFLYSDDTQYDWMDIIDFLFDEIVKMRAEIENLTESNCKDIMKYIRHEASRNGFDLPEEIDGEPLTVKRVFHDLLELLRKREVEIKEVNDRRWKDLRDINKALGYDGMDGHVDDFAIAVKARAECTKRALGEESDINQLIRDCCAKHGVIAPSRYFSDEACVEYLFSVSEIENLRSQIKRLKGLINAMNEEVKDM